MCMTSIRVLGLDSGTEREKERKQNKWRRQLLLCFHYDGEPFISALHFLPWWECNIQHTRKNEWLSLYDFFIRESCQERQNEGMMIHAYHGGTERDSNDHVKRRKSLEGLFFSLHEKKQNWMIVCVCASLWDFFFRFSRMQSGTH